MSSILDDGCCLEAVPCDFFYKYLILSRAIKTLRFQNSLLRSEADEGALHIRDRAEYSVCRDILAKS
jgi:hypothetical protein